PVTQLGHEQCKQCGVYERMLFLFTSTVAEWTLCPANFSLRDPHRPAASRPHTRSEIGASVTGGVAVVDVPGVLYVSLACDTCAAPPPPPPAQPVTQFDPAVTSVTGSWVTSVILSFAFIVALAMCCVIALILRRQHRRRQPHDEMEKSRFLGLHGGDSSSSSSHPEQSHNAPYLDKDTEGGDDGGSGVGGGAEGVGVVLLLLLLLLLLPSPLPLVLV
ncbi:hypothetical protein CLOP_g6252, partial [Closterium sp. NIES-67]